MDVYSVIRQYIGNRRIARQDPRITLWAKWYRGKDPAFHVYRLYNGTGKSTMCEKKTLGMGKVVCETWADLLLNEKTDIILPKNDKKILDQIFSNTNFWSIGNAGIEKAFALGLGAFVVEVKNLSVDEETGKMLDEDGVINIEFINAKKIYPITKEHGKITECAFASIGTQESTISIHLKNPETGNYEITNLYFTGYNFAKLMKVETFGTFSNIPWFHFVYPNIVNNYDIDSGMGISVLANVIDNLKAIDNKYDSYDNEFVLGKKRMYIATELNQVNEDGSYVKVFDPNDVLVYRLPPANDGKPWISYDSTELRAESHNLALNGELSILSYKCGFGKGYFIFNDSGGGKPVQTATAVISMQSDLFRTVKKHEIVIEQCLKGLVKTIIYVSNTFTKTKFSESLTDDKIEIHFDDSIFEDKESEKASARLDMSHGVMSKVEYRMKFYGETEAEATKNINKFNVEELANKINALMPAVQAHLLLPKDFVKFVYGEENPEIEAYIVDGLEKQSFNADSLINQFNNDGA